MVQKLAKNKEDDGVIQLKRTIGYFSGTNLIIGVTVGSGIFISPGGVMKYSQLDVGIAMIVWLLAGLLTMLAALCYAELGAALPLSGGNYYHIKRCLGPIPAFIFLWTITMFRRPASVAIKALTFAEYAVKPFYYGCAAPVLTKKCTALASVWLVCCLNCISVKWASYTHNVFTVLKVVALAIISIGGLVVLTKGKTQYLEKGFIANAPEASYIGQAFYHAFFAYSGWGIINNAAEELKNPSKNIPRCIMTAIPMVTVFYLLVNISYLTVMTPKEVASSASVAITWADRVIGSFSWIIPMSVAISTFGSINGSTFSQGRLNYAASREGHMPPILAMLHVKYLTPAPGIIFSTIISSVFIIPSSLLSLTGYFGFSSWLLVGLTCLSLIVLRFREPTLHRPYKVFLPFAFVMVAVSCFLVLAPIIQSPQLEYIYALLFMLSGLIIYFPFVYFKLHFKFFDKITYHLQLLMEITHSEVYENGSKNQ
ncbi:solute carrier family 7 member 13-like [Protopterus annectens]|uniref:solute carrier family 7 member 13-like n=1 Tax=Protopterus annectens TaxID=7888 RepID=UPI001CFA8F0D|nr:solute carrier family 7 member 13-like [Protopterus annectens]